ncbi:MAG: HDOD domain-containing protein [Deltaproteobacteria bacterium]|jgi:HD-like signal output (HDOD) protein|nr:HDOD domain-containing protein [Deltaproteobacteria bacterium]
MALPQLDEKEIRYRIFQINDFPPMPISLERLLEVIQNEVASIKELESIVQYDQTLSAKIMRIANSSYYGFRGKISTLARAMVLMGFEEVRSICLCTLLREMISGKMPLKARERETFWKHALVVGRVAALISQKRPWISKAEAYTLGLLHDLGQVIMAAYLSDHYHFILKLSKMRNIPMWCAESAYEVTHTVVGRWLAVKWGLPEVFQRVLEFHHAPEGAPSYKSEVKMIYLADVLSNSREYPEFLNDDVTLSYCSDLCVTEEEWEEYREELDAIWSEVDQIWNLLK